MIREGSYDAVAVPDNNGVVAQWDHTANNNKYVAVTLMILEGPYRGHRAYWRGYFTKETHERTMESLRYMGWDNNQLTDFGRLNSRVSIEINHQTYKGKTRARVAWINPLRGRSGWKPVNPPSSEDLRMFSAQMSKIAETIRVEPGKDFVDTNNLPTRPEPIKEDNRALFGPAEDEDDLPF